MTRLLLVAVLVFSACSSPSKPQASSVPGGSPGATAKIKGNPLGAERSQTTVAPSDRPGSGSRATATPATAASSTPRAAGNPTPTPVAIPDGCTDGRGSNAAALKMVDTKFQPDCLVVNAGQSLKLSNEGELQHNFTITGIADLDLAAGKSRESAFDLRPAQYPFFCKFHRNSGMTGTLVVTRK